jgi:uridylate kinase
MDNDMPIIVFNLLTNGNIGKAVRGANIGTLVYTPPRNQQRTDLERRSE